MDPDHGGLAIGLAPYSSRFGPAAAGRERWLALATIWILALIDMAGLRLSSRALNLLTAQGAEPPRRDRCRVHGRHGPLVAPLSPPPRPARGRHRDSPEAPG